MKASAVLHDCPDCSCQPCESRDCEEQRNHFYREIEELQGKVARLQNHVIALDKQIVELKTESQAEES